MGSDWAPSKDRRERHVRGRATGTTDRARRIVLGQHVSGTGLKKYRDAQGGTRADETVASILGGRQLTGV